jgi:hypothetical protein
MDDDEQDRDATQPIELCNAAERESRTGFAGGHTVYVPVHDGDGDPTGARGA